MIGIYKIESPTNKIYIGQSWNIEKRMRNYKYLNCENQPKIYNSLKKYGFENHVIEILYTGNTNTTQLILNEKEHQYWQDYSNKNFNMLNCREANGSGGKHSKNTLLKMSLNRKGKLLGIKQTEDHIKKRISKIRGITKMSNAGRKKIIARNKLMIGDNCPNSKINNEIALKIWLMLQNNFSILEIQKELNVNKFIVFNIKRGECWNHITGLLKNNRKLKA